MRDGEDSTPQIQPLGGGLLDIVPAPSGIRAVGDGACRPLGVAGADVVMGEARDPAGVTGFAWSGFIRCPDWEVGCAG
jgi:hypothetical protein